MKQRSASVEPDTSSVRLVLVEELALLRSVLAEMLSIEGEFVVSASLQCDAPIVEAVVGCSADVLIAGVDAVDSPCLGALNDLRGRYPECRVVALTMPDAPNVFAELLAVPVQAIVDKYTSIRHLMTAVRVVVDGGTHIPRKFIESARTAKRNPFTSREREVLRLASHGATAPEIARELSLSEGTVRNYLSSAMSKTEAHTRIGAIRTARRFGWL